MLITTLNSKNSRKKNYNSLSLSKTNRTKEEKFSKKEQLLSKRQLECLKFLAHGKRIKEIAKSLNLSPRTIETYINLIKQKVNCTSRSHLIDFYWEN